VAYTGTDTPAWHGDIQGIHVSVQGNILVSQEVLNGVMEGFINPRLEAPNLGDRLLAALEAGSSAGGDARCGKQTALSAFLAVADPDDARGQPRVRIVVPGQRPGGRNPVEIVRERYEELKSK
jgi:uncharacterized Ntn-hydrolase superfamily protein